ncbi:MAG: phospholipase [Chloroflexi bacterium]|nr:MAG: phospholipase [Chloroflexota bacterium]
MYKWLKVIIILVTVGILLGACSNNPEEAEVNQDIEADPTEVAQEIEADPTVEPTSIPDPTVEPISTSDPTVFPLPERAGPRTKTSGTVPHVQIDVEPITAVNDKLFQRAFTLPGVEDRPTIVSLPGARGMWLTDDISLAHPEAIVSGREFAHIHPDGSLHAPLPYERALEVAEKGWGERHPWADEREGWDGLVMLFTPQSMEELDITFQLIVESYNHVTGQTVQAADFE